MLIQPTGIPGVFLVEPRQLSDQRGNFYEGMRSDLFEAAFGRPFAPRQVNYSVSHRNTLRGLHTVAHPPGQAKYVTCVRGRLQDIVVDLRLGSPTYGQHISAELDARSGRSVFIPEGVAHGFLALEDDTCISYVVSTVHVPGTQIDIDALDPELALPWRLSAPPIRSPKDAAAPRAARAAELGLLTAYEPHESTRS
jgi:NDP-hexose 3,5-(Or5-) epimerase